MSNTLLFVISLFLTGYLLILIPAYWKAFGPDNFFWLSDIGLFLTVIGLWCQSSLLISTAIILTFPLDIIWVIDFILRLITRKNGLGIVDYMFNSKFPIFTRSLSLFHIFLPILWFWCLLMWGYNQKALWLAIMIVWLIFPLTYFLANPAKNINWVHYAPILNKKIASTWWRCILFILFPLLIILPMHVLLSVLF